MIGKSVNGLECTFHHPLDVVDGGVAEWFGRGLQSLAKRFDSARRLNWPLSEFG